VSGYDQPNRQSTQALNIGPMRKGAGKEAMETVAQVFFPSLRFDRSGNMSVGYFSLT
jgi:hypothetical protein